MIRVKQINLLKNLIANELGARHFATVEKVDEADKKTPLFDFHIKHGAKIVPFAGYLMPVQYSDQSLTESHFHTRNNVSIFDVSHMLQTKIYGKHRSEFMESLTTADVQSLKPNHGTLTVFTNEKGGIKDDLIVTKTDKDYLYVVTNAGCIDKDLPHMRTHAEQFRKNGFDVTIEPQDEQCLIAVQGPKMMELLYSVVSFDIMKLYFMTSAIGKVCGIENCRVTRCGYTGEDGVEISVGRKHAADLCNSLLKSTKAVTKLAGLGVRDSLRLEAGLCLYGNDIDETTTPVEANLTWLIAQSRRKAGGFPGADIILKQLKSKTVSRKRVGFIAEKGRPPRAGALIVDNHKNVIGKITSGCPSPSLKQNIAMGYVNSEKSAIGTKLSIDVTGQGQLYVDAKVVKMPFVPTHYHMPPKK